MLSYPGLSDEEVLAARARSGTNNLPQQKVRPLDLLMRQFRGVFNVLLLVAAVIALFLGEHLDAGFILLFLLVGAGLGFYQEFKSNLASEKLKGYLTRTASVYRAGILVQVPIEEVVPGDVLALEQGDIIPADADVLECEGFLVNEEPFTGESIAVAKDPAATDGSRVLLQGTTVLHGRAIARVTATGIQTRFAQIARHANAPEEKSLLNESVDKISTFILRTTLITLLFVLLGNVLIKGSEADLPLLLIFAISLAVSVIPEALPLVSTFSLSRGAVRLAQEKVIVKRLSSVQDLGSISILCTDKTGTITENKLKLVNEYYITSSPFTPYLLARFASNDLNKRVVEPFDAAVLEGLSEEDKARFVEYTLVKDEPFDPAVRSNGAIVSGKDGRMLRIRRGAPEYILTEAGVEDAGIHAWIASEELQGRRVLALSYAYEGEQLTLGGLLSFVDTLKPSARDAIKQATALHVGVRILTGDAKVVAESIGREVGLVTRADEVCTADEFFARTVSEQLRTLADIKVFARTSPEQKLIIIELFKRFHRVGFLGEGINDVPALKTAHASMVVQSASDVSRESADIVLLDSDLRVVVDGIRLGRETHANVIKYIRATLISNFGNFYAVAISTFFISFLPMLPKQILLLNLLSDVPMMAIAFDRVSREDVTNPQTDDFRSMWIVIMVLGFVSTVFDFLFFGLYYRISPEVLQTNWFIGSVLTELLLILSVRTMLPFHKGGAPARTLLLLSGVAFVTTILLPFIPATASFFGFVPPSLYDLVFIVVLAVLYLGLTELLKVPLASFLKRTVPSGR